MKPQAYLAITALIFSQVALAHLVRVMYDLPIMVGSWSVPMWLSWISFFMAGGLTIWALMLTQND